MILNAYTIIILFTAVVTGILSFVLAVASFVQYQKSGMTSTGEGRTEAENRSYLLLLIASVILIVKLLSWPFFYVTLQSYVPHIHGAMCIFGVIQGNPELGNLMQIFKPLVFFLIGGWLLLNALDRKTERAPLFRRKILFLSFVSIMALIDSAGDLIYFTSFQTESDVGCCTLFFDLPDRTTAMLPMALLGENYLRYLLRLYYFSNSILILLAGISYTRFSSERFSSTLINKQVLTLLAVCAAGSLLNAALAVVAFFEVIAPVIMELPYHHCIYCMWQYAPESILMTALFIVGTFSLNWALLLYLTGRNSETMPHMRKYVRNLYFMGITALTASLAMVVVRFILKG